MQFAHAHKATGPVWDGKEEPLLLGVEAKATTALATAFEYAYGNEKKSVKIYIDFDQADTVADEGISLVSGWQRETSGELIYCTVLGLCD
jgi:hypothetical protein